MNPTKPLSRTATFHARPGDRLRFADQAALETWLEAHHEQSSGIWLEIAKKGSRQPTVTYPDAIETALCFGWIDGQKARGDEEHWLQRLTPRSSRSRWSRINRDRAERLITAGRMRPSGLAEVNRARNDGRWADAYEGQRNATVPDDLQRALDADTNLATAFASLDSHSRYSIVWHLNDAKRPDTRERRLAKYLDTLRRGQPAH